MKTIIPVLLCTAALLFLASCGRERTLWKDISTEDFTEFYYTVSGSAYPPEFQRYRFYSEDGSVYFYHETREGDHWPLTENDVTVSGTMKLSDEQASAFFAALEGGTVKQRSEIDESGDSGPWLYLYWKGDKAKYQEFSFADYGAQSRFVELCLELKELC
ncbi:MAG: hypothetical protein II583_00355 [Oscillospiraceae bacterium]|nr:hypothetical protein [Oscillospiraceae bacterium]